MFGGVIKSFIESQKQDVVRGLSKQLNTIILELSKQYQEEVLLKLEDGVLVEVVSTKQIEPLEVVKLSDLVPLNTQVLSMLKAAGKSKAEIFKLAEVKFLDLMKSEGGQCVFFRYNETENAPDALVYDSSFKLKKSINLLSIF